jgi:hypothetical protein
MSKRRIIRFIFAVILIVAGLTGPAVADDVNKQIWVDFDPSYYFNPHLKVFGEIGGRTQMGNNDWWRLVIVPAVRTRIKGRFYFTGGAGNYYTFNELIDDRYELAPYQMLDFKWPKWKIPFHHHLRVDERFDFNTVTWDSKNSARARYKLKLSFRWAAVRKHRYWQVTAGAEGFYSFAGEQGQFRERSRVTLGLNRSLARNNHLRFEVTWQQKARLFQSGNISDIYFRFRYTRSWGKMKES